MATLRGVSFVREMVRKRGWEKEHSLQSVMTHTFLDASGKAYVPDDKRGEIADIIAEEYRRCSHESYLTNSISEILGSRFTLCFDADFKNGPGQPYETRDSLIAFARVLQAQSLEFYPDLVRDTVRFFVGYTAKFKMHGYLWPIVANEERALTIRTKILATVTSTFGARESPKNSWANVIDDAIYRRSLRPFFTRKYAPCPVCRENEKKQAEKEGGEKKRKKKLVGSTCTQPDCWLGHIGAGNDSIYHLEFILKSDGSEDRELLDRFQDPQYYGEMLRYCTVWHGGRPLTPWTRPAGVGLWKPEKETTTAKKRTTHKKTEPVISPEDESGGLGLGEDLAKTARDYRKAFSELEKKAYKSEKCNRVVLPSEPAFKMIRSMFEEGNFGDMYKHVEVKSVMTDSKTARYFVDVKGGHAHFCELAEPKREHKTAHIYVFVSRFHQAAYVRCWHPKCQGKSSLPYPLRSDQFQQLFPASMGTARPLEALRIQTTSKAEKAEKSGTLTVVTSLAAVPSSKTGKEEKKTRNKSHKTTPALKKIKLADLTPVAAIGQLFRSTT